MRRSKPPHPVHGSLVKPESTTQMASRSVQPFWLSFSRQTHRPHYICNNRPHDITYILHDLTYLWSTQPCIPLGSLNRVPASAGVRAGMSPLPAGWQVTLCDPMWHVSSRSGVATLRTAIHLLLTLYCSDDS